MCGRFTLTTPAQQLASLFDALEPREDSEARYNIAPTQPVLGVRLRPGSKRKEWASFRWGLIPSWTERIATAPMLMNARCETMAEKPSFREAFRKRRCLIPADGFFEWKTEGSRKVPHWIHRPNREPFAFAGLWESWKNDSDQIVETCTIVTTQANTKLKPLHERMPVIVPQEFHDLWLDASRSIEELQLLFSPAPESFFQLVPVGNLVNSAKTDSPKCIEAIEVSSVRQLSLWEE